MGKYTRLTSHFSKQAAQISQKHSQITHKKREINSHRYDAMLSLEGCVCRWWWGGVFGDYRPNWQQAEDAASFRRSNLASVIADTINGGPRGAAGGAETEV